MATNAVVVPEQTVLVESVEHEITEQNTWQEFSRVLSEGLANVTQTLERLVTAQTETVTRLDSMMARVPENLTQTISDQQATITRLVGESMETVRSLLTPPPEPVVVVPPTPENQPVAEVVPPEAGTGSAPPQRKRLAI